MIEIVTHLDNITLDLAPKTVLSFDENSKGFDSNAFVFDYTNNISLPYSPRNVDLFNRYGFEKFKVLVKSDGLFIGNYFAQFTENNVNINTNTGTYQLDIFSLFKDLDDTASDTKLKDAFTYSDYINGNLVDDDDLLEPSEPKLHAALRIMQANPNLDKPYRFPEYHLVKSIEDKDGNPFTPDFYNTIEDDFGNEVNVNHLNNTYHAAPPLLTVPGAVGMTKQERKNDWDIKYLIQYDTNGFIPRTFSNPAANINTARIPRRLWGIVTPCFNYLFVLEKSLNYLGLKVRFEWSNADMEKLFKNLYLLNNYNIYDVLIERNIGKEDDIPAITYTGTDFVKFQTLFVYPDTLISGTNHMPDISVLDLLYDFLVKTNCQIAIEGDILIFKSINIKQSDVDLELNPNIRTVKYEYLEDKVLKYNYTNSENPDNIPDYRLAELNKNSSEIVSDIVPTHIRTLIENTGTGAKSFYPYILGTASFNPLLTRSLTTYIIRTWQPLPGGIGYSFTDVQDPKNPNGDELASYTIHPCPLYCSTVHYFDNLGVSLWHRYYPRPVGLFFYYECIAEEEWREFNTYNVIRSLRWEGEKGIFEHQYKPTLLILMAKLISYVKAKVSVEMFSKFDHYHYFPINGKRAFPLKRKYKLLLSSDNQIEIDFYIVD